MDYTLIEDGYKSTSIDDSIIFLGLHQPNDMAILGCGFHVKNVTIIISISYSGLLPLPDANSNIADLNSLTEFVL